MSKHKSKFEIGDISPIDIPKDIFLFKFELKSGYYHFD